jgi:hypothetical protein
MYAFNVGYRQDVEKVIHFPLPNLNFQKKKVTLKKQGNVSNINTF